MVLTTSSALAYKQRVVPSFPLSVACAPSFRGYQREGIHPAKRSEQRTVGRERQREGIQREIVASASGLGSVWCFLWEDFFVVLVPASSHHQGTRFVENFSRSLAKDREGKGRRERGWPGETEEEEQAGRRRACTDREGDFERGYDRVTEGGNGLGRLRSTRSRRAICGRLAVVVLLLGDKVVSVTRDCLFMLQTGLYGVRFPSESISVVEDLKLWIRRVHFRLLDARSRRETCWEEGRESCVKVACDGLHNLLTHSCFGGPRTPLSFVAIA
ncbi:hypothetical protein R1flu_022083 [Riccia fluitans]|uniref:Uncharacterized protein n=1 Tax=Riccia fluitans TaxID=41844 RepID=A0ABD1ZR62_9MARC